jgi:UDP-N-acetyl-D-glucosamine dehydrogenase
LKIAIIGQGYVGLPLAIEFCKAGHTVVGFDSNIEKIDILKSSKSYIDDITESVISEALKSGRFIPTYDSLDLVGVEVAIIAVPTPLDKNRNPDLTHVNNVSELLGKTLNQATLIINESTSYPGTLRNIIQSRVTEFSKLDGIEHSFAVSPERVDPGNKQFLIKNTPRLVAGLTI